MKIKVLYNTIGIQDLRMSRSWDFYAKTGIAGYEMSGIITDLGEKAKAAGYSIGQHVTGTIAHFCGTCSYCRSGQENNCLQLTGQSGTICDYIIWNYNQLVALPKNISLKLGCLLEPVAVVYMAFQKLELKPKENLCIFGGDFNGLVLLQLARLHGAGTITVVERKEKNRLLALSLGADYTVNPEEDAYETKLLHQTDFTGFQAVAITSSDTEWFCTASNVIARGGRIMITVYYDFKKDISINSIKFFAMNLTISSSFLYTKKVLHDTADIMASLRLEELISQEYPLKDALAAFEEEEKFHYPRIGLIMPL